MSFYLGWEVAQEYQRNPINSEDEKVMNRALSKVERKTKSEMAKMRHMVYLFWVFS
jgi:hypothetical protein